MSEQVNELLAEREKTHGSYADTADLAVHLRDSIKYHNGLVAKNNALRNAQQHAVDMICTKLARIACGDALLAEHWRDIAGYATLAADDLERWRRELPEAENDG